MKKISFIIYAFRVLLIINTISKYEAATVVSSTPVLMMNDDLKKDENILVEKDSSVTTTTSSTQTLINAGIHFNFIKHLFLLIKNFKLLK